MLLRLYRYIRGYLKIRITGSGTERFLNGCRHKNIHLWDLYAKSGAYEVNLFACDFRKLKTILRKTGTKVTIVKRMGLPFFLFQYRRRKIFFSGCIMGIFLLFLMTRFIWDIDISGNQIYTKEQILDYLKTRQVYTGMIKSKTDCNGISADLRENYGKIIWVSTSVNGNRLCIQIKENTDGYLRHKKETISPGDLVADADGIITEIVIRKGVPKVRRGKHVKKGQILVSGQIPVKDDSQTVVNYQYCCADAEIKAEVKISYEDAWPNRYKKKQYSDLIAEEDFLRIKGYEIGVGTFPRRSNGKKKAESLTLCRQLEIIGRVKFPVYYGKKMTYYYQTVTKKYTIKEQQQFLSRDFSTYCRNLEKKGVEILENDVKIYTGLKCAHAKGTLKVLKSIGVLKPSKPKKIPKNEQSQQGENIDGNDGNSH